LVVHLFLVETVEAVSAAAQEGGCYGGHCEDEVRAEVGVQLAQKAEGHGDGDGFFDVDVEALDVVFAEDGEEGVVVGVELGMED
jgi:U3 small nucleolar ribonucleoprotein component